MPELLLGRKYGHSPALLGPRGGPQPADGRPRRRAPDGAGAAALARPRGDLGIRRRRRLDRRPVRVGVALAPGRRRVEGRQGHHDPRRARGRGRPAAGAAAVRRRPAAGHRHRPVRRRPDALRLLLGHRRAQAVRRVRPRATRARSARSTWVGSSAARRTPPRRRSGWPAVRRWWRSAATAGASTSPTRCTARGTTSSTPAGVGAWMAKIDADPAAGGLTHRRAVLPARRRLPRPAAAPGAPAGRGRLVGLVLLPLRRRGRGLGDQSSSSSNNAMRSSTGSAA